MLIDLGKTDEEKWINILKIRDMRSKLGKLYKILVIIGTILLCFGILGGSVGLEGSGKIGSILFMVLFAILSYYGFVYTYGTFFAWGMFIIERKNMMDNVIGDKVPTEDIVRAYFIGGHDYASYVAYGDCSLLGIAITFCIGIWLGAINAILKFPECKQVERRIKEKYKNQK